MKKEIESKSDVIKLISPFLEDLRKIWRKHKSDYKINKNIKKMIHTFICVSFEKVPVDYISKQTIEKLPTDLQTPPYNFPWNIKRTKNKEPFKEFLCEHCNPLNEIIDNICNTNEQVSNILEKQLKTAWIAKKENELLDKNYRKRRPGGWKKCYKECDIKLLDKNGKEIKH